MRIITSTLLLMLAFYFVNAQDEDNEIVLSQIKSPSSPASIIIGNQAPAISRPKSWSALEASVFSNYLTQEGGIGIPNNYAIEFSPYWAKDDLKISNEDFLVPNAGQSILQNLSFSISSTQNFIIRDSIVSNAIGFGFRTMIWQGTKSEKDRMLNKYNQILKDLKASTIIFRLAEELECANCSREVYIDTLLASIEAQKENIFNAELNQLNIGRILFELKEYFQNNLPDITGDNESNADNVSNTIDSFLAIDATLNEITKLKQDRKGWKLEVAVATSLDFPTNQIDFSVVPKSGLWLTPSFQPYKQDWIEFLGVFRYFNYNLDFYENYLNDAEVFKHTYDYGLRLAFKFRKYTLEFEGVGRTGQSIFLEEAGEDSISDFQYLLNFNYQISDKLILTYNFGKEFNPIISYNGNLISLISLNFGLHPPTNNALQ